MNTGAEGVETSLKLARKWAYIHKGVPHDEAIIVSASDCFHGRTLAIVSLSDDPEARSGFGPFLPNVSRVTYNDIPSLEQLFEEKGPQIAAFLVEPIQGEAGVVVPDPGYLRKCKDLCEKHNVLLIADEVQSVGGLLCSLQSESHTNKGLGRTGKLLACEWDEVRPDMVILGKALSGGVYPMSCVLTNKEVMLCIQPGTLHLQRLLSRL
jgi:ornithine--oxo-acid transaminase